MHSTIQQWRIFLWAALHSPDFRNCYVNAPISLQCRHWGTFPLYQVTLAIAIQPLSVYIPYSVADSYSIAHGGELYDSFDDIPF